MSTAVRPTDKNISVAFQGERGAFSDTAARALLHAAEMVPCATFESLFAADADYILAPLENTLAGVVQRSHELWLASDLHIVQEVTTRIAQHLVALPGARLSQVRTVESHPVALAQCKGFFAQHRHLQAVTALDTAGSVKAIMQAGDVTRAAIGGEMAARLYGAEILLPHVEDDPENYTRFGLLTRQRPTHERAEKLAVTMVIERQSVEYLLSPFAQRELNPERVIHIQAPEKRVLAHFDIGQLSAEAVEAVEEFLSRGGVGNRVLGWYRSTTATEPGE